MGKIQGKSVFMIKYLKGVTRVEVDCVKVNSQCTECNIEVIADRNLQIPGPECE